jgi:hypothetical protein
MIPSAIRAIYRSNIYTKKLKHVDHNAEFSHLIPIGFVSFVNFVSCAIIGGIPLCGPGIEATPLTGANSALHRQ